MLVLNILRRLLTRPVELLLEILFASGARFIPETGLIIPLTALVISIPITLLCLRADTAQRRRDALMENTKSKRAVFLRQIPLGMIPEILHFTAGLLFFNDLAVLHGIPFLMISDLGVPDGMLHLKGFTLNLLPVLVTAVHIISRMTRTRGLPTGRKILMWALTAIYFSLLYGASAGFAFYRLVSELLYLAVSTLYRNMPYRRFSAAVPSAAGALILLYVLCAGHADTLRDQMLFIVPAFVFQIPAVLVFLRKKVILRFPSEVSASGRRLFTLSCVYLTILTGLQIPSMVIRSAPSDFINITNYYSPFHYIFSAVLTAAGTFLIWPGIMYLASSVPARYILVFLSAFGAVSGTINVMFFGNGRGIMSTQLVYDVEPADTAAAAAVNIIILILAALCLLLIRRKKEELLNFLIFTLCVIKTVSAASNCVSISRDLTVSKRTIASAQKALPSSGTESAGAGTRQLPEIPLSVNGKNVIVIMMDRSIGYFLPFIMAERPELQEQFDGFTFYPNTVSFGSKTNEGSPALFGGYEYTPERINEREDITLASKHNEALRLMPVLFAEAGYRVTVVDPPYAGYQTIPDLDIYEDYPEIRAWHAENMLPLADDFSESEAIINRSRNFFCYSIFRTAPLFLQPALYSKGTYNKADTLLSFDDMLTAHRDVEAFQKAYNVLVSLPEMTAADSGSSTFFIMDNRTTHEPTLLQLPDYTLTSQVDNTPYETLPVTRTSADGRTLLLDDEVRETHYHINMAAFIALGAWMDNLKENGVYDNTRIIIVSDHGHPMGYETMKFGSEDYEDVLTFNPVLLVKDFDSRGFSADETFMTNADTPTLAFAGLIDTPVNPATGNPVTDEDKTGREILIKHTEIWDIKLNNGDDFLPGDWYCLTGEDIFDTGAWEYRGRH